MIHRHLDYEPGAPVADVGRSAIDDILDRGDLADWAPIAAAVRADPRGTLATAVLDICQAHTMYGTSQLWTDWICRLRDGDAPGEAGDDAEEAVSLGELRTSRGLTQADVAAGMGGSQPDVSKLEARQDVRLSTLAAYVAATGGSLRCQATYADGETYDVEISEW